MLCYIISKVKIIDISEIKAETWNGFVEKHPLGNVFQTKEMYEVYCHTKNNMPIAFAVEDKGQLQGLVLADVITNGGKLMKPFTARSIINGGPLVLDGRKEVFDLLMSEYTKRLPCYVVYSEIRPVYDFKHIEDLLKKSGFGRVGHYNLSLDVSQNEQTLWNGLHKERRRNINHAIKEGLVFREVFEDEEIGQISKLISKTYKRKQVPMSQENIFFQLKDIMGKYTHFFAAYYQDKMIAGQVRLCFGDLVYAWYAGSDEDYFKLRPNDFLMWNVILWSHEKGYSIFDFGGGGEPGVQYGVRDYKLKYGCNLEEYGRFIHKHHPIIYSLGKLYAKKVIKR